MNLTRIQLDSKRRETMKAMANRERMHAAIARSCAKDDRPLWRIDQLNGSDYLMILSRNPVKTELITEQFSTNSSCFQEKNYDRFLTQLTPGMKCRFRLVANPTVSKVRKGEDQNSRGKVYGHVTDEWALKWLLDRCAKHGFKVTPESVQIVGSRWIQFFKRRGERPVSLREVIYEGQLTIIDPVLFRTALTNGLGRGKAYGMGMMTVIPLKQYE